MKAAISSRSEKPDAELDRRFGRAAWFLIYDSSDGSFTPLKNDAAALPAGAGGQALQQLLQAGVEAVITAELGPKAAEAAEAFGVAVFHPGAEQTISGAAAAWSRGELEERKPRPLRTIGE